VFKQVFSLAASEGLLLSRGRLAGLAGLCLRAVSVPAGVLHAFCAASAAMFIMPIMGAMPPFGGPPCGGQRCPTTLPPRALPTAGGQAGPRLS
jgi:hypothetical protein